MLKYPDLYLLTRLALDACHVREGVCQSVRKHNVLHRRHGFRIDDSVVL